MTGDEALHRLAGSTADAVLGVLQMLVADEVGEGGVQVVPDGTSPFAGLPMPSMAANVSYVDVGGVRGGYSFVISKLGARRLAAKMMMEDPPETALEDLTELETSAVTEAANQMMGAAAAAIGSLLGQEVEISTPEIKSFGAEAEVSSAFELAGCAAWVPFTVCGEEARLILFFPPSFVVRLTGSLDEQGAGVEESPGRDDDLAVQSDAILDVPVRLWAELGRFRMELGRAVSLSPGAVVELQELVDEPVDVLVNGTRFGRGELLVADDGTWAVRIGELVSAGDGGNREGGT